MSFSNSFSPKKKRKHFSKWTYQDHFEYWFNHYSLTPEEQKKLQELDEEMKQELFSVDGQEFQFGTSGIRALMGIGPKRINVHTCRVFAEAYAKFITSSKNKEKGPILVGFDNRENGRLFALTICKVLKGFHIPSIFSGESMATPVLAYLVKHKKYRGGIMITASHNSQKHNGIKLYGENGGQLSQEEEKTIRSLFAPPHYYLSSLKGKPKITSIEEEWWDSYLDDLEKSIRRKVGSFYTLGCTVIRTIKFLFSSHHGTSSGRMLSLARVLGALSFKEYFWECTPTHLFPDEEITNPENPRSFRDMEREGKSTKTDYLIAHDPDSDRGALGELIKNDWYYFTGNEMFVLLAAFLLELSKSSKYEVDMKYNYLVTTHVSGNLIDKVVKYFDPSIEIRRVDTGFKSIGKEVERLSTKGEVLLGCEEAIGGLFFPELSLEKDAFQQTALTMLMIGYYKFHYSRNLLTQLFWLMWKTKSAWQGKTVCFNLKPGDKTRIFNKLKDISEKENSEIQLEKYKFTISRNLELGIFTFSLDSQNWVKARFSGTEDKFKLYFNLYSDITPEELEKEEKWESIIREKRAQLNYLITTLTKKFEAFLVNS
ncbi:phosphohexomutase domain-containing protein [Mycoplasma suis]|uniref:Phosphoglucomutase/phosphomannomutase n=1 Tax=Mycoplasma suis (strain Illinois) TaxID=768700 RepID=F0QQ09_MYCSL|nr:phosphoglucomutase [Mycoplasma suis]ADX97579.1 phosphoglucomutase/phosphomannomutase [Mycoplasma suis str. Illinois]